MAAFDSIEYFGIALGRDNHAAQIKKRRQSSLSLASGTPLLHVPEKSERQRPESISPSHSFANLTPEDSIFGLTFGRADTSPLASPKVSSNSTSTSMPSHMFPLDRYVGIPQRHEQIALSFSANPQCGHKTSGSGRSDDGHSLYRFVEMEPDVECLSTIGETPMYRYLADACQAHEQLALALERSVQRAQPTSSQPTSSPVSSISLNCGCDTEEDDNGESMSTEMFLAKLHEQRQRNSAAGRFRPRLYKTKQSRPRLEKTKRKRRSESLPAREKEKMARRDLGQ